MSELCKYCGAEIPDEASECPQCGAPHTPIVYTTESRLPAWLLPTISVFIPIVGFILYFVFKEKDEDLAKECGKYAIIGAVIDVIFFFI